VLARNSRCIIDYIDDPALAPGLQKMTNSSPLDGNAIDTIPLWQFRERVATQIQCTSLSSAATKPFTSSSKSLQFLSDNNKNANRAHIRAPVGALTFIFTN
jgi:hypothetical protein